MYHIPNLLLAQHLTSQLESAGINVSKPAGYQKEKSQEEERKVIYVHKSPLLSEIITETNFQSNNHYAEQLFRYLGSRVAVPATVKNSVDIIKQFWKARMIDLSSVFLCDGSGLAPQNAIPADVFVDLLTYMSQVSKYKDTFISTLPVAGETGTLSGFLKDTSLHGKVQAKSGYLLDDTPKTITVKDHQTYTLEVFNQPKGGLVINKLDSVTHEPLEGVEFTITEADGTVVDDNGGMTSSMGLYRTDENGQIILDGLVGTFIITETKTIEGYTIHEETRTQTVVINPNDTQTITVYNDPIGGVELVKVNSADKTQRIPNVTFEIREMDGALVDTVTTDRNGRVFLPLEDGAYYAVETEAAEGFQVDPTPHYFEVEGGKI